MKRQRISEREKAEADEKAQRHRTDLLADLQAREAARRGPSPVPEGPAAAANDPQPDEAGEPLSPAEPAAP